MRNIGNSLKKKIGPLPAWAWLLILGAALYLYRKHQQTTGTQTAGNLTSGYYGPYGQDAYPGTGTGGGSGGGNGSGGSTQPPPTIVINPPGGDGGGGGGSGDGNGSGGGGGGTNKKPKGDKGKRKPKTKVFGKPGTVGHPSVGSSEKKTTPGVFTKQRTTRNVPPRAPAGTTKTSTPRAFSKQQVRPRAAPAYHKGHR